MTKKISKLCLIFFMMIALGLLVAQNSIVLVNAKTNTDSEYVNTVTDLKTTNLLGGVTLYEQKMSSLLNGDEGKRFQEHFVQWVDLAGYGSGVKLVTHTKQTADSWSAATTKACAQDWEKSHPGWIVIAGTNGDFFQNSGTITWEPTNNFMADGNMYRADVIGGYRSVVGINEDNSVIVGMPTISQLMQLYIYNEDETVREKLPIQAYNVEKPVDGLTLYTKDYVKSLDLTGCTVYVGEYTLCRISNGAKKTVFVKGQIKSSRAGTTNESPKETRQIELEDGTTKTLITREFYIVDKNATLEGKISENTSVKCQFDYEGQWQNVQNSVGYVYQMLDNGTSLHQKSTDSFVYTDHPRTFIGFKADGTPVLMVVDGRGETSSTVKKDNYGVSLFEGAEIMKLAGCVNAYNLDGGGSSTLIARNSSGGFDVINRPSDYGNERSTGNAVFLVIRDPGIESVLANSSATTIQLDRKKGDYAQQLQNVKVTVDGKTYDMSGDSLTIGGLKENTTYSIQVDFEIDGEACTSSLYAQTKAYDPGIDINPTSNGFEVSVRKTDEYIETTKIVLNIEGQTYPLEGIEIGKSYYIEGLLKGESYEVGYRYEGTNKETGEKFEKEVAGKIYETLGYEIPRIERFELEETRGKVNISYRYSDVDGIVTKAYIDQEGKKIEIEGTRGSKTLEGIDRTKDQKFQLYIEYEYEGLSGIVKSEVIILEQKAHEHTYKDADCTHPKTCTTCGETEGEPLGHTYKEADCTHAKTCTRCNETVGEALGHTYKEADCTHAKTCTRCNETEGNPLGHTWKEATKKEPKTCTVCGTTVGEPKKGCKKASAMTLIASILALITTLMILRKKR